jgi:hypothetical protein
MADKEDNELHHTNRTDQVIVGAVACNESLDVHLIRTPSACRRLSAHFLVKHKGKPKLVASTVPIGGIQDV